jgi:hypothetical protein
MIAIATPEHDQLGFSGSLHPLELLLVQRYLKTIVEIQSYTLSLAALLGYLSNNVHRSES